MSASSEAGLSRSHQSRQDDDAQLRAKKRKKAQALYDPDQDPIVKRELRRNYRTALEKTEEAKKNVASFKPEDLIEMLKDSDRLYEKVVTPQEGVLDARNLLNLSEMGNQMAKSMKVDHNAFDITEFINKAARFIGGKADTRRGTDTQGADSEKDEEDVNVDAEEVAKWDWAKLGRLAGQVSKRAPAIDFLLGPLAIEKKQRKVVHRQPVDNTRVERSAPQQLGAADLQQNAEDDLQVMVRNISKLLQRVGGDDGVNVYRFAVNPQSFGESVENWFYVSFMIKEGKAGIVEGEDGEPILTTPEDYARGARKKQFPLSLTPGLYKKLIKDWDIREAIIPSRTARQQAVGSSGWY